MDFLTKIQLWLAGASSDVEGFNEHAEEEKEKYDTSTTRKACLIVAIVAAVVVFAASFLF